MALRAFKITFIHSTTSPSMMIAAMRPCWIAMTASKDSCTHVVIKFGCSQILLNWNPDGVEEIFERSGKFIVSGNFHRDFQENCFTGL